MKSWMYFYVTYYGKWYWKNIIEELDAFLCDLIWEFFSAGKRWELLSGVVLAETHPHFGVMFRWLGLASIFG